MSIKILLHGKGKMGKTLCELANQSSDIEIECVLGRNSHMPEKTSCSVAIDFSNPAAVIPFAEYLAKHKIPLVTGTTGIGSPDQKKLKMLSKIIPIVQASNFSIGVNLLHYLVQKTASVLGSNFHSEIIETHHAHKIDSPSGTALSLAKTIKSSFVSKRDIIFGRKGLCGPRNTDEIAIHSVRGGSVIGDHSILFLGPDERIELSHKAGSRVIFAKGALQAAIWLFTKQPSPKLYSMKDVLGL